MASERIPTTDSAWSHHDYAYVEYDSGLRAIGGIEDVIRYLSTTLGWEIDVDDFEDIEDVSYDFEASDIGLKEEAFAKVSSLRQLQPLIDGQRWGVFCVEFESKRLEVTALRKILSGLVPKRRNAAEHAVWEQEDLLFICFWGQGRDRTVGIAHFEDKGKGLPQIKIISCAPASEDFTQLRVFGERLSKLRWPSNPADLDEWGRAWSAAFETGYRQTIRDSSTLTIQLAKEARGIRNRVLDVMSVETRNGYVHLLYDKFRDTLIHDMTEEQFADMYAQTVVYGLFSARCMDPTQDDFSADEAIECIPSTNPFLKSLMRECLGSAGSSALSFDELEIGNVTNLLMHADTESIISDFNRQTGGGREDPVIHFYEEFLTAYDKTQKVERGVYYTPQPVVNFIVRAVDHILKEQFGLADGLASEETKTIKVKRQSRRKVGGAYRMVDDTAEVPAVQVLDPATGTGTFIRQTILQIYKNFREAHAELDAVAIHEAWNEYIPKHLLPRLSAFELMMAPYAVAHMKLAMVLKDTGYDFSSTKRLNVCLTNTLEKPGLSDDQMTLFDDPLALESIQANKVKKNKGINIVLGNPPYSTESQNNGEWINELMSTYKVEPGTSSKLKERNSKPLNDDYIKFIRYGQHVLSNSNSGILAYVNPHGFLDGPIFRGLRYSLLSFFDAIYILDLHGNANRQETTEDGGNDENVFDIKQGVCVAIFVKLKNSQRSMATVYRADVMGTREKKYSYLLREDLASIPWGTIHPEGPYYLFCKEDLEAKKQYEDGVSVKELFGVSGTGVLTKRDELCVHFNKHDAFIAAKDLAEQPRDFVKAKYHVKSDVRDWKYEWAKQDVISSGINPDKVRRIAYRPLDFRYVYYTGESRGFMGWPVYAVMQHVLETKNVALVTARSNKSGDSSHFYVSDTLVEYKCGERTTNSSVFPLYVVDNATLAGNGPRPNFNSIAIGKFEKRTGLIFKPDMTDITTGNQFGPYALFSYIYACLYSTTYRSDNKEFLNRDFPVVPYPVTSSSFFSLATLGDQLIKTHLLHFELEETCCFYGADPCVTTASLKDERVYINKTSYFEGVDTTMWGYTIGGYQPCQRWLKDRKGRTLTGSDINMYRKLLQSIAKTIDIVNRIDECWTTIM